MKSNVKNKTNDNDSNIARALLGTCPGPDFAPDVTFKPEEKNYEPTVMWARCVSCSDENHFHIRNRTIKGLYLITKSRANEFAKEGQIKLPSDDVLRKYIIQANYCDHCILKKKPKITIIKRIDFDRF